MTSKRSQAGCQPLAAFTLVELLTVITITAVLAAILFPVIYKVRESGKSASCISNMRQLGLAVTMYIDDNDNRFPSAAPWGAPSYWKTFNQFTIAEALQPYASARVQRDGDKYSSCGVFACPSDTGLPARYGRICGVQSGQAVWKSSGCSYEYYSTNQDDWIRYSTDPPQVPWTALAPEVEIDGKIQRIGAPASAITDLSGKAVMGDTFYWHMGDSVPDGSLVYRNTIFADGHAERVRGIAHVQARIQQLKHWHSFAERDD
jgi:competence protein ComGC